MRPIYTTLKPGQFFYVVTPHPDDPKRKYLHSVVPKKVEFMEPEIKIAPVRSMAKKFVNIVLARSFADFLNKLPNGEQFCVAVE